MTETNRWTGSSIVAMGRSVSGCAMKLYTTSVSQIVAKGPRARVRLSLSMTYLVIRSSMERGSRINVGSTTRLKSAPGRNCEMMCERTDLCQYSHAWLRFPHPALTISLIRLDDLVLPAGVGVLDGRPAWVCVRFVHLSCSDLEVLTERRNSLAREARRRCGTGMTAFGN